MNCNEMDFSVPDVIRSIRYHLEAYENLGIIVPPFRITRRELKEMWNFHKKKGFVSLDSFYDEMISYMGVYIEVVTVG